MSFKISKHSIAPSNSSSWTVLDTVLSGLLFALALYLYFVQLNSPMVWESDETKAYLNFFPPTPGLYMFSRDAIILFKSFTAPYYVNAFFGLFSSMLIFGIVRMLYSHRFAMLVALAYITLDLPLAYARILFYSTLVTFFALLAIWLFLKAEKLNKPWLYILAGFCQGMMLMMHPSAYASVLGVGLGLMFLKFSHNPYESTNAWWLYPILAFLGFVAAILLVDHCFFMPIDSMNRSYFVHMGYHQQNSSTELYAGAMGWNAIKHAYSALINSELRSPERLIRHAIVYIGILSSISFAWRSKDKKALGLMLISIATLVIIFTAGLFNKHTVFLRHYTVIAMSISFCIAYSLAGLFSSRRNGLKIAAVILALVYFTMSGISSYKIAHSLLSLDDIDSYLHEQNIEKKDIVTAFYTINRLHNYLEGSISTHTPTIKKGHNSPPDWEKIFYSYLTGQHHYYISSGIGGEHIRPALKDVIIKYTEPLQTWRHPHDNPYLTRQSKDGLTMSLYRIEDLLATYKRLKVALDIQQSRSIAGKNVK
ncbi:MAG: hypothetical protein ACI9CF_000182 [Candidatus Omnitrophota bacterium]